MGRPLLIMTLSCLGLAASGCAPALPRADEALELPGLGPPGKRLEASYRATETSCRVEERRLSEASSNRASALRLAETVLALGAGGLAVGAAIYAGLDTSPKGYVVVPLAVGAAAGTVPLGVLLASGEGVPEVREREQRIRDRRLSVRDAYHRQAEATADRERAETGLGELERRLSEERLGDAARQIEASSSLVGQASTAIASAREAAAAAGLDRARPEAKGGAAGKGGAGGGPRASVLDQLDEARAHLDRVRGAERAALMTVEAGRAAVLDAQRAEVAYAKQRERDAERALGDALQRLGEVCGAAGGR